MPFDSINSFDRLLPQLVFFYLPALWASGRATSCPLHGRCAVGDKCVMLGGAGTGSRDIGGKFDKKEKKKEKK